MQAKICSSGRPHAFHLCATTLPPSALSFWPRLIDLVLTHPHPLPQPSSSSGRMILSPSQRYAASLSPPSSPPPPPPFLLPPFLILLLSPPKLPPCRKLFSLKLHSSSSSWCLSLLQPIYPSIIIIIIPTSTSQGDTCIIVHLYSQLYNNLTRSTTSESRRRPPCRVRIWRAPVGC